MPREKAKKAYIQKEYQATMVKSDYQELVRMTRSRVKQMQSPEEHVVDEAT